MGFLFWWGFFRKISFVWAFLRILFFWWQTEAWQGSWETFSLCMRCSEVIISATQCVKSAATPCQNVLFRFSTVHFVTPSTPPPDQDLWITKYRAGQNFVPVLQVDLLWTIYQIGTQDMSHFHLLCLFFISSVRSSNSHPDLLVIHHPTTFSDHTGPQHWTFTFWATTAI